MKIAIVHDDFIQFGGAEELVLAMHEAWPKADVFCGFASNKWLLKLQKLGINTRTSFMQRLPLKERLYRYYFFLFPLAFESFDFSSYDLVISSSARFAHFIITKPQTMHICYMNSPGRMFWNPNEYFSKSSLFYLLLPFLSLLRVMSFYSAQRVDVFISNSKNISKKIKKYFRRKSFVIYPFVKDEVFNLQKHKHRIKDSTAGDYFLIISRLVKWKKIDIAIESCKELGLNLKIIGDGPDRSRLEKICSNNIQILGRLDFKDMVNYLVNCKALIVPQEEDFGIVILEANACGKPVIAFKGGGALETVIDKKTGLFFYPQSVEALVRTLTYFSKWRYNSALLVDHAKRFNKGRFIRSLKRFVYKQYEKR